MTDAVEPLKTVTARVPSDKVAALDELAGQQDRDSSYLINEAIDQYLAHRQWMLEEINKAIAEADTGLFVPHEEVEAFFTKWTK
jgi:RHH-type transcriptional regulator, rel operon repressor / antitoxin RelB